MRGDCCSADNGDLEASVCAFKASCARYFLRTGAGKFAHTGKRWINGIGKHVIECPVVVKKCDHEMNGAWDDARGSIRKPQGLLTALSCLQG